MTNHSRQLSFVVLLLHVCSSLALLASAFTAPQPAKLYLTRSRIHPVPRVGATSLASTSTRNADDTQHLIQDMVSQMTLFFADMVDVDRQRFYYLCLPPTGERKHQHMPIRDLAAAWDTTKALRHHSTATNSLDPDIRQRFQSAVYNTIQAYNTSYKSIGNDGGVYLDSDVLLEPSNIAHSALLILGSASALRLSLFREDNLSDVPPIDGLVRGILSMQRPSDGAFRIEFGDSSEDVYRGIDFFPGEAMLALMDAYELSGKIEGVLDASTRQAIMPSMERAFEFYSDYFHRGNADTNYNIWQIQALSRYFDALRHDCGTCSSDHQSTLVANHILQLCQDIIDSRSWKYELSRGRSFYPNLNTIEIVCGLDALADGIRVALVIDDVEQEHRVGLLERNAQNAVYFIQWAQEQVSPDSPAGCGGLGYGGVQVFEQRLDVTGHAISALAKLYQMEILP